MMKNAIVILSVLFLGCGDVEEFHPAPGCADATSYDWCGSPTDDFLCNAAGVPVFGCDLPMEHVRHCVEVCQ